MNNQYELSRLSFSFSAQKILDIDELQIRENRVTAVVGPNGAGKSTLFDILAFLKKQNKGELKFRNRSTSYRDLPSLRKQVGYVQQKPYLMKMPVRDNIGLGLKFRGISQDDIDNAVNRIAEEFRLYSLLDRDAKKLSGGEIQKVALARALVLQPDVLIMDEPFTYLDETTGHEIEEWMASQRDKQSRTVIFSTHDKLRAQSLSDSVISLINGQVCPVSSDNLYTGHIDKSTNTFDTGKARFEIPATITYGHKLFIDPKHLVISKEKLSSSMRNNFQGKIVSLSSINGEVHINVNSDVTFHVVITPGSLEEMGLQPGGTVWVSCKSSQITVI